MWGDRTFKNTFYDLEESCLINILVGLKSSAKWTTLVLMQVLIRQLSLKMSVPWKHFH